MSVPERVALMERLQEAEAAQYQQTMDAWLAAAEIVYSDEAMAFMGS